MLDFEYHHDGVDFQELILVWNTATGASNIYRRYKLSSDEPSPFVLKKNSLLPSQPLGQAPKGKIMMDLEASTRGGYLTLVWDTKSTSYQLYDKDGIPHRKDQLPKSPRKTRPDLLKPAYNKGQISADYVMFYNRQQRHMKKRIIFWDKRTGASCLYAYAGGNKQRYIPYAGKTQLPLNPLRLSEQALANPNNDIRMKMIIAHHDETSTSRAKMNSEILVWNATTGKSKVLAYSSYDKKYEAINSRAQLPRNPLGKAPKGKIMIEYVPTCGSKKTEYEFLVWDTATGESKYYYYSAKEKRYKSAGVGLPAVPLK